MGSITTPGGSSSSSCKHSWIYDVFLSFRGKDTRNNFTCHLHSNLVKKGINTFIDEELPRGEEITPALLKTIEGSRISVIVFSENYAFSKWCLEELTHILHCKGSKQQVVYPVFYKVDPSDVRNQKGRFGEALDILECRFKDDLKKVEKWRGALTEAAHLGGWAYSDGNESKFMEEIIDKIHMQVLSYAEFIVAHHPVGIECRVQEMDSLLGIEVNDVRMIGIWGIAGIGKSTIARAVYNSHAHKFDGSCFLEDVGRKPLQDLVKLQNRLLSKILGLREPDLLTDAWVGMTVIKNSLSTKRVLLILDDVNDVDQLRKLAGDSKWFGLGSRIIITTRDIGLLTSHGVTGDQIYKPKELNKFEALALFSANAFPHEILPNSYKQLADDVVEYAEGLPLALEGLGKFLCGKTMEEWQEELNSPRKSPQVGLYETLKISYNALENQVKQVFLDIACFFKGKQKNHVIEILGGGDLKPKNSIKVLQEKALISIEEDKICMHNLLEVVGKEIVHTESPEEPGERSRLWFSDNVYEILSEGKGTDKIKGVMVVFPSEHGAPIIPLIATSFSGMRNLKYFINSNAQFSGDIECLPNELRLIDWPRFPFESLPLNYVPKKLVKLNMPDSGISRLGEKFKSSRYLKYINLENCQFLKEIPDFSGFPNLRDLNLNYCTSLVQVDESVGTLSKLVALRLSGCYKLITFPTRIDLKSVRRIIFRDCRNLKALPKIVQNMEFLTWLDLSGTDIKELPASFLCLISLEELSLRECKNLTSLPCNIYDLQHLRYLDLHNCSKLVALPEWNVELCPTNLISPSNLRDLNLCGCKRLQEIPELPPKVELVNAADCLQLERFAKLSNILEHKKSQMIKRIILLNCERLCKSLQSLACGVANVENVIQNEVTLCSLFLSCKQSEFEVVYPGSEVPKWFSHSKDLKELNDKCKVSFEISPDLKFGTRGLAICAVAALVETINPEKNDKCSITARVDINGESNVVPHSFHFEAKYMTVAHVWLWYFPFVMFAYRQSAPFTCGVSMEYESQGLVRCKSYGVHLVRP